MDLEREERKSQGSQLTQVHLKKLAVKILCVVVCVCVFSVDQNDPPSLFVAPTT